MLTKALFAVATFLFVAFSTFTASKAVDSPPVDKTCCPPGWQLVCDTAGTANFIFPADLEKRDRNEDGCLCLKRIPNEFGNGNTLDSLALVGANFKDNNQPCRDR